VKRAALLQQYGTQAKADVDFHEYAQSAPAALDLTQCLLPGAYTLQCNEGIVRVIDLNEGQQLVSSRPISSVRRCTIQRARQRDIMHLRCIVAGSARSLQLTANHAVKVLQRGCRAVGQLPAGDIRPGDKLCTRTSFAVIQSVEPIERNTGVTEIEFTDSASTMFVAEGEELAEQHFVEVYGELAPPSRDDYVKVLKFKRFDDFGQLHYSPGLRLCKDQLERAGFSVDSNLPRGQMYVGAHLARRVLDVVHRGRVQMTASSIIVSRQFEHAVLDAVKHDLAPARHNFLVGQMDLAYFLNKEPLDLRRVHSLWFTDQELSLRALSGNGTPPNHMAEGSDAVLVITVERTFINIRELQPEDDESVVTMSDHVTTRGRPLPRAHRPLTLRSPGPT